MTLFFFSFILGGGLLIGTREAEMVKCKELREREGGRERERERERESAFPRKWYSRR